MHRGTAFTMATVSEFEFAKLLCERVSHFDKLRFVNSGTEAVMACIKAARCFTGRTKIAKVEGTYHGTYDYAEVSQKPKPEEWGDSQRPASVPVARGTPQAALDDVVVIPFNNASLARQIDLVGECHLSIFGRLFDTTDDATLCLGRAGFNRVS